MSNADLLCESKFIPFKSYCLREWLITVKVWQTVGTDKNLLAVSHSTDSKDQWDIWCQMTQEQICLGFC